MVVDVPELAVLPPVVKGLNPRHYQHAVSRVIFIALALRPSALGASVSFQEGSASHVAEQTRQQVPLGFLILDYQLAVGLYGSVTLQVAHRHLLLQR